MLSCTQEDFSRVMSSTLESKSTVLWRSLLLHQCTSSEAANISCYVNGCSAERGVLFAMQPLRSQLLPLLPLLQQLLPPSASMNTACPQSQQWHSLSHLLPRYHLPPHRRPAYSHYQPEVLVMSGLVLVLTPSRRSHQHQQNAFAPNGQTFSDLFFFF